MTAAPKAETNPICTSLWTRLTIDEKGSRSKPAVFIEGEPVEVFAWCSRCGSIMLADGKKVAPGELHTSNDPTKVLEWSLP